jgi:microcystin-dependent protein
MAEPFLSEIRLASFVFAPKGWALCNGQLLPINQNQPLFSLPGTTYGGDGRVNFALPDLRGNVPIHMGGGHTLGEKGGSQAVTLSTSQMPTHTHAYFAQPAAGTQLPAAGALLSQASNVYRTPDNFTTLQPGTIGNAGGSQAHNNMMPFLTLSFCIALQGIFPSPT